jgi:hypothetical protein
MKKLIAILCAVIVIVTATAMPVSAAWENKDGNTYYVNDKGEKVTGWLLTTAGWCYLSKGKDGSVNLTKSPLMLKTKTGTIFYSFNQNGILTEISDFLPNGNITNDTTVEEFSKLIQFDLTDPDLAMTESYNGIELYVSENYQYSVSGEVADVYMEVFIFLDGKFCGTAIIVGGMTDVDMKKAVVPDGDDLDFYTEEQAAAILSVLIEQYKATDSSIKLLTEDEVSKRFGALSLLLDESYFNEAVYYGNETTCYFGFASDNAAIVFMLTNEAIEALGNVNS